MAKKEGGIDQGNSGNSSGSDAAPFAPHLGRGAVAGAGP